MNANTSGFAGSFEKNISKSSQRKIENILGEINRLGDVEKFLLYLQLPTGVATDHSRDSNAGNKAEIRNAQLWIRSHLQEDPELCLPKQEVFDEYREYCSSQDVRAVGREDFGKLMKTVFPNVRSRRLGTRGQTKHCYGGLTQRSEFRSPSLPSFQFEDTEEVTDESEKSYNGGDLRDKRELARASCALVCEWAEKLLQLSFTSIHDVAEHLIEHSYVRRNSEAAYTIMSQIQRFREAHNITVPQRPAVDTSSCSGASGSSSRSAKHQLQLKLQEKGRLKEQKRKLEQQRSVIAGSATQDDSWSQDTTHNETSSHMINDTSVSMSSAESSSLHGQSSKDGNSKSRSFPSASNPKPILPKPATPMITTPVPASVASPSCKMETESKLVLVSPSPQPLMLISPAPLSAPKKQVLVPLQQSNNGHENGHLNGNGIEADIKPDIKKLDAARALSKAISQAMARSPRTQGNIPSNDASVKTNKRETAEQKSTENSKDTGRANTTANEPVNTADTSTSDDQAAQSFHRSQSAPGTQTTGMFMIQNEVGGEVCYKSEPVSNENTCQPVTNKVLKLPTAPVDGTTAVNLSQGGSELGKTAGASAVALDSLLEAPTAVPASATPMPSGQELLTTLGTQVLAALAAQQLSAPGIGQLTPTKKTKTVQSLLREQRVKSTSPETTAATRSHYVNDNRPVAQILKELREKKRLHGGSGGGVCIGEDVASGGATQKLSFDSGQSNDETILTLKQRIAREASVMKKAQLQGTKIKKETLSRDASPVGSPAPPLARPAIRSRASTLSRDPSRDPSRESSPVGSPAGIVAPRTSLKRAATLSRDTSPIGSPVVRHRGRAFSSAKVEENTRRVDAKRAKQRGAAMARKASTAATRETALRNALNINCDAQQHDVSRPSDSFSYPFDEISPGGSSAILSAHSTAYHSNASSDSLESSFAHDRSRHSSGDLSFRSRHSSGDPNFRPLTENTGPRLTTLNDFATRSVGESVCASNNPTLASLLSPDRGPHMETRNLRLAALLREQDITESPPKPIESTQFKKNPQSHAIQQGVDNPGNGVWNNNESFSSQTILQQCLNDQNNSMERQSNFPAENSGTTLSAMLGHSQQGATNTSQFMPIQSVTEANIVSPVRPQAMVPGDRTNMGSDLAQTGNANEQLARETQAAQRLRVLLNSDNTEADFATNNPADNSQWLSNNQTSSFVPYSQACSNTNQVVDINSGSLNDSLNMTNVLSMQPQQQPSLFSISETKTYSANAGQIGNTFNDGFASMEGVRPPLKRNLDSDQSFLSKRQRHHSDQTNRRSKRVNFMQPMQPLLLPDKPIASPLGQQHSASSHESLPLLSPQIPNESPFSPEVQAIMSNDDWDTKEGYRSHSVPAHNFMQPNYDPAGLQDGLFNQQVGGEQQAFNSQDFMLAPPQSQLQSQQNLMQPSQNTMQPLQNPQNSLQQALNPLQPVQNTMQQAQHPLQQQLPMQPNVFEQNQPLDFQQQQLQPHPQQLNQSQDQTMQLDNFQQQHQHNSTLKQQTLIQPPQQQPQQQNLSNIINMQSPANPQSDNARKTNTLLQFLAQRLGSKKSATGGGLRGDHMISGASAATPQQRERIKDTLQKLLQTQQFQQLQQQRGTGASAGQFSMHNPTPTQSHPTTPVDFSHGGGGPGGEPNVDMSGQAQGMMGNGGMVGYQPQQGSNMAMAAANMEGLHSAQQDPLFGMCTADDNDNMSMINQNSHLDVFL